MVRKGQKPDLLIEKRDEVVVGKPPWEIGKAARLSGKRAASRRLEEPGLGSVVGGSLFCRCDYLNIKGEMTSISCSLDIVGQVYRDGSREGKLGGVRNGKPNKRRQLS